ncbi:VTT domain-containing protein [Mangrovibacterium marinum]|uniref:SNARE associated Golgi protein n=1 Tax=Mangrovibacterium marinum TaxID=1639118 RepID=A0A2T5C162_9BACT|nr:VTT domain-containing protein [Mangrovibacterium marinum]PTN08373.1 SNARE associated Golgi protein [Mangrovibacterium marinum]
MNISRQHITRAAVVVFFAAVAIAIASATIGREIYGATKESLLSFGIVNFSGYLFFLIMPVELAFIYYLHSDLSFILLNVVAVTTALGSQMVDYYIGHSLSARIINKLIGRHRYQKAEEEIQKYGNIAIFLFNLLPLSSPLMLCAAGMLRHPLRQALIYSALGLTIKYLFITIFFL